MKKKITLTIDDDVYDQLGEIPGRISVSEMTSWFFRFFVKELKLGRELKKDEIQEILESTPEGQDFRDRLTAVWGPRVDKIEKMKAIFNIGKKVQKQRRKKIE